MFAPIVICFVILMTFCASPIFAETKDIAESATVKCDKEVVKAVVHSSAIGLGALLHEIKDEKKRVHLIRTFIDHIRFYHDNSGYLYVYDYNCVNIAHAAQKDLQGKNLYDYKDAKDKFAVREVSAIAKNGGGFVEYYWKKSNLDKKKDEVRKIGYAEPIPGTTYFIGSGLYLPE